MSLDIQLHDVDGAADSINVRLDWRFGILWITPEGHGDLVSEDGHGYPLAVEYRNGEVCVLVWDDINVEDPKEISLAGAKESRRVNE